MISTMIQKKIILDLDGVVVEYDFPKIVKSFFGVDLSPAMIFAYDLADVLGVAPALIDAMFQEQVYGKPNFIDGSLEVLTEWKQKGYEIAILSNRVKYMGVTGLAQWLIDWQIPFSGIDLYTETECNFHIDDSSSKLASSKSDVKLLYTQPWNKRCLDIYNQFKRVNSWEEIGGIVD